MFVYVRSLSCIVAMSTLKFFSGTFRSRKYCQILATRVSFGYNTTETIVELVKIYFPNSSSPASVKRATLVGTNLAHKILL